MADIDDLCGRMLGAFVLRERLDQGGFGTVYRADQISLGRAVVVKVLRKRARRNDVSLQRFAREALLSSELDHPYAAHVYAFGVEDDGLVWIAMELVQGVTLSRWLEAHGSMPLEEFVPFFERLAEVVHVAHERGIIHRDLKPSNVMLIERAGQLLPKLLDFGVARLLDGVTLPHLAETEALVLADETPQELAATGSDAVATVRLRLAPPHDRRARRLTRRSNAIGSPPYMAPEQWDGASDVTPAMDLYALGVLAYEALTGRRPFEAARATEYVVLHRTAPVPSLGEPLVALDGRFRKALAKDPLDRFRSALDFAAGLRAELEARMVAQIRAAARHWDDRGRPTGLLWRDDALADLERWIDRTGASALRQLESDFAEASRAHQDALDESGRKRAAWLRRAAITGGLAVIALAAIALQIRTALQARNAAQQAELREQFADLVVRQRQVEQGRAALLHGELSEARLELGDAVHHGDHSAATEFMFARSIEPALAERMSFDGTGRMWSAAFSPDGTRIVATDDHEAKIWDVRTRTLVATLRHAGSVHQALFSADGTRIFTASSDGTVGVWRADGGELLRRLGSRREDGKPTRYLYLALTGNGHTLAAIDWMGDRTQVWDVATGALLATLKVAGVGFASLAFSPDDRWIAVGGGDEAAVFSTTSWTRASTIRGIRVRTVAFHPSRPWLATGALSGDVSIWDVPTGSRIRHVREVGDPVDRVAFSPDGNLLAIASRDGTEQLWHADTGRVQSTGVRLQGSTIALEFDPSARLLLAAGGAGNVVVADVALGMPVVTLEGSKGAIFSAHFDRYAARIVSASWDGTARIWDARPPDRSWATPPISDDCGLFGGVEPDARLVAIGCRDLATRIWDTARDQLVAELPSVTPVPGDYSSAYPAVSADGARAAIARGSAVELYELPGGRLLRTVTHQAAVNTVAFSRSGHAMASGSVDGSLIVTRDGLAPQVLPPAPVGLDAVGFLPDHRLAAADAQGHLRILSSDGAIVHANLALDTRVRTLRFSPDGSRLAIVPRSGATLATPELWDVERYQLVGKLSDHVGLVYAARFVGDVLLTAGSDSTVRMWDTKSGRLQHTYRAPSRTITDATIDPSGTFVVAGGGDGSIRIWDLGTERRVWQQSAHRTAVAGVHFQEQDLITRGFGGDLSRWTFAPARTVIEEYDARKAAASRP